MSVSSSLRTMKKIVYLLTELTSLAHGYLLKQRDIQVDERMLPMKISSMYQPQLDRAI